MNSVHKTWLFFGVLGVLLVSEKITEEAARRRNFDEYVQSSVRLWQWMIDRNRKGWAEIHAERAKLNWWGLLFYRYPILPPALPEPLPFHVRKRAKEMGLL